MKIFLRLIVIISFGISYSQEKQVDKNNLLVWTKATCEEGVKNAKKDFKEGNYKCYSYGFIITLDSLAFIDFLDDYRKKKYGIITKNAGCVTTERSKCYSETMESLVFEKFGSDIFEKSQKEAQVLFDKKVNE